MKGRLLLLLLLPLLLPLACALAQAEPTPSEVAAPTAPQAAQAAQARQTDPGEQDYLDALQSIADGRKQDASAKLKRLFEKVPQHAGAWLELALIQCSLGHAQEAEQSFHTILTRFDPPPHVIKIIEQARARGCDQTITYRRGSLMVARGYDRNVNQGASGSDPFIVNLLPEFRPLPDHYALVAADMQSDINANGMTASVQFQARRNDHLRQYDNAALFFGAASSWRLGRWTMLPSVTTGLVSLGGSLYQRQLQLQTRFGTPVGDLARLQLSVASSRIEYRTLSNFDATTFEARAQFSVRGAHSVTTLDTALQDDRARAERPGGNRHGSLVSLQGQVQLGDKVIGEAGYSRQSWFSQSDYSPGLFDITRRQVTQVLRAALAVPMGKQQVLQLELRQSWNRENIPVFQYNNRQIQLNWLWQFQ